MYWRPLFLHLTVALGSGRYRLCDVEICVVQSSDVNYSIVPWPLMAEGKISRIHRIVSIIVKLNIYISRLFCVADERRAGDAAISRKRQSVIFGDSKIISRRFLLATAPAGK